MRFVSAAALAFALVGCNDYNLQGEKPGPVGDPAIDVSPDALYYTDVDMGGTETQNFTISSVGEVTLDIMNIRLEQGTVFSWSLIDAELPLELAVGDTVDVAVTYTRAGDGESDAAIVESNDPAMGEARVLLNGGDTLPALEIVPASYDFGAMPVGETATTTMMVRSTGSAPVNLTGLEITGTGFTGSWDVALPLSLDPGDEVPVYVEFSPPDIGTFTGALNATGTSVGTVTAPLNGEGAGGPIAVCYATPSEVEANSESTTWYGADSYDTGGRSIISWTWTLVSKPGGSGATMPAGGANRRFSPDLAGTYVAELIVENDLGEVSEPCTATVEAIPGQDLWVEMYWDASQDDMDLHLLRPGASMRSNPGDCYYANTSPDWGVRGDPIDDPSLDLDDIPGTGPENININEPYETGDFEVWVDDYSGSTSDAPSNTNVTVNIYIGGVLVYNDTKSCARECADMHFANITWPAGTITAF